MDLAEEAHPAAQSRETPRLPGPAALGMLVAGALLAAGYAAFGMPAILLGACMAAGYGMTWFSGLDLVPEERLAFGSVIGAMVATLAGFALASSFGLTPATVWGGVVFALGLSLGGWWRGRRAVPVELEGLRIRWLASPLIGGHPWPLLLVVAVCGAYTLKLMGQAYQYLPSGLYAGEQGVWGDWAAHLAYAGSFAYGANFPPDFPIDPGHRLGYPFMIDFLAASMVRLGASLPASLVLTSGFLGLLFPAVMYLAGVRLLGGRLAAALAVFVFLLGGGLGFTYFLKDVDSQGWGILFALPHQYTHMVEQNYQWLNPVLANLLPQRSTLFGFSVVLIAAAVLFAARNRAGWAPFAFAGVLVGIAPSFHVHSYGTAVALAASWAVLNRRREWIAFFVPALLVGLPALAWMWPPAAAVTCAQRVGNLCLQPGWLAAADGHHDSFAWFWIKNLGVFIPMVLVAQFWRGLVPTGFASHFSPIWLWFLVPNIVLFHPWDWDNNKFFIFFELFGALLVGALLAALLKRGREGAVIAVTLCALLGASGFLDLLRSTEATVSTIKFTDESGLEVAAWARASTAPRSLFVTAPEHNSPIPSLAGRRVLIGYTGWVWSYGLSDWSQRETEVQAILAGGPAASRLASRHGVDYVVIGPQERAYELSHQLSVGDAYWQAHGQVVYRNAKYTVYRV